MNSLRSALVWGFTWTYMLVAGIVSLPWLWATRRLGFTYALARGGIRALLWLAGVRVVVTGREHLAGVAEGRLYMANHQSNLDPPILLMALPGEIAFLAKQELFRVPVLGSVLRMGGLVGVDRGTTAEARAASHGAIARAAEAIQAGRPYLIFPEGTRSPDGHLLEFKKGPFYLAEQAGAVVVPVSVRGTGRLMPRGTMRIGPGRVEIIIRAPIAAAAWREGKEPRAGCAALVRAALAN